ncbi:histidine phosphatase family protein [Paractinoplanes hotanensis]|uniref:Histidine phosphatase family protein n=1 Tax=Paractinoplanes hotanensis TaxID=2906497 RepID=A0ABT0Y294_9ACTN|nr:histidine phosphatase family protein [Actinoplanes hotanensis]MCM4080112.1 histidine phosphatase family protein [Actinoplanes hotanensis]
MSGGTDPRASRPARWAVAVAMRVILVRHAMPEADPARPPHLWRLGASGAAGARALSLPPGAWLVASTEPKAAETLQVATAGGHVLEDAGFDEVRRPHEWRDDHRERARAYVEGATPAGWEPRQQVAARFTAAVARHAARAGGGPLVVGTHGMALTTWLAAHQLITGPPGSFWAALAFPDVVTVDLP